MAAGSAVVWAGLWAAPKAAHGLALGLAPYAAWTTAEWPALRSDQKAAECEAQSAIRKSMLLALGSVPSYTAMVALLAVVMP